MRWRLKPSKTVPSGENRLENILLVDGDRSSISAGFAISSPLHMRGDKDYWDLLNTPLFLDPNTGNEVTIASSRKMLAQKVKEVGLSPQHVKSHSLRIGGATADENSPNCRLITVVFLCLWASGARLAYIHVYRCPLELAGLAVARETGADLAVRPGPVGAYEQGQTPN